MDLRQALQAADTYRAAAADALAARSADRPIDHEQRAAHGFAWVATTVAALGAVLDWREAGQGANPLDGKIATLAFAEGIGQLVGGLPMGQNEMFRPADLGLGRTNTQCGGDCRLRVFQLGVVLQDRLRRPARERGALFRRAAAAFNHEWLRFSSRRDTRHLRQGATCFIQLIDNEFAQRLRVGQHGGHRRRKLLDFDVPTGFPPNPMEKFPLLGGIHI